MDVIDLASEREIRHRELSLAAQLAKTADTLSYSHCLECGDDIPEARRKAIAGAKLCVVCQERLEHRLKVRP